MVVYQLGEEEDTGKRGIVEVEGGGWGGGWGEGRGEEPRLITK